MNHDTIIPIEDAYAQIQAAVPEVVRCEMRPPFINEASTPSGAVERVIIGATSTFHFLNGTSLSIMHALEFEPVTHIEAFVVEDLIIRLRKASQ